MPSVVISTPGLTTHRGDASDETVATTVPPGTQSYEFICDAEEHGEVVNLPLDKIIENGQLVLYPSIRASRYLNVARSGDNRVRFFAKQMVGLIPINARVAVRVRPRIGISSLSRVLRIAGFIPHEIPDFTRGYTEDEEALPSILG